MKDFNHFLSSSIEVEAMRKSNSKQEGWKKAKGNLDFLQIPFLEHKYQPIQISNY